MDYVTIVFIAIGLSMDSFAVSLANGLTIEGLNTKKVFLISFSLALFQALMPLFGWFLGRSIEGFIQEIDHWIAFILLFSIGMKMIYESFSKTEENSTSELKPSVILVQSFATSIDAFAIGISFAILNISIVTPILIIGGVTHGFSLIGLQLGKYLGKRVGKYVEIFGGIVLVGIGIKILVEHIYFH